MKRGVLILAIMCLVAFASQAQLNFGIKAGLTSTSIKVDETIDINDPANSDFDQLIVQGVNSKVGLQGGIFARVTIVKFFVQPELLFTSTSGEVEVTELLAGVEQGESVIKEQSFNRVDIPIMVGGKFGPVRLQAGPIASIMLSSKPALSDIGNYDYEEEFNSATWGYQAGVGLDISKLTIDLKYEGSLSKLGDGINVAGNTMNFDSRNNQIVLSLGYMF